MNVEVKPSAAAYKLLIEKDVDVPMRDGARLKADVFRPDDGGKFPAILNLGPYQKDKLWVPPPQLEEKATPNMNWETVTPGMVGAEGLRRRARRRPRQRQVAGPVRAVVARRGDRFLRRHRMGGGAAVVQRQGRAVGHFLLRHQPVVRRQSAAAVAEGDHPVGGLRRHLPRRAVPRRPPQRVHDQLVHRAPDAPRHGPRRAASIRTAGRPTRCGTGCTTISTAARCAARRRSGTGSRCRCSRSATGPASRCICAATPRRSCAPPRSTRSCASTTARTCIRSTPRRASAISFASSTTGSRASTTA